MKLLKNTTESLKKDLLLTQALAENELLDKLEKSRKHAAQGECRDAIEISRDMRDKYGL